MKKILLTSGLLLTVAFLNAQNLQTTGYDKQVAMKMPVNLYEQTDGLNSNTCANQPFTRGSMAFGTIVYPAAQVGYWTWDVDNYTGKTLITAAGASDLYGGTYFEGNLYAYGTQNDGTNNTDVTYYVINATTGNIITSIPKPALYGSIISALAYDYSNNTMYAISSNTLYTVNLATGDLTNIAAITGAAGTILTMAINLDGVVYVTNSGSANLYTVNKTTGVATLVGATGRTRVSYAQSIAFDHRDGTLYWCVLGEETYLIFLTREYFHFMKINTATGGATMVQQDINAEITNLHFPYENSPIPCERVTGLTATAATAVPFGRIHVEWDPNPAHRHWEVEFKEIGATNFTTRPTVTVPEVDLTSVAENTNFLIRVRGNCRVDMFTEWDSVEVRTSGAVPSFTITPSVSPAGTGTIDPSTPVTVTEGDSKTFTFEPAATYSIDKVLVNGTQVSYTTTPTGGSYTFPDVRQDYTIQIQFRAGPTTYTITPSITPAEAGTINPNHVVTVFSGDDQRFTFSANNLCTIDKVLVNGNEASYTPGSGNSGSYTFENVTENSTINVIFTGGCISAIEENEAIKDITIYPNPTSGKLQVTSDKLQVMNVKVLDVLGKVQKIIINYQLSIINSIDISHLSSGIYFLQIETAEGIITQKVIKN